MRKSIAQTLITIPHETSKSNNPKPIYSNGLLKPSKQEKLRLGIFYILKPASQPTYEDNVTILTHKKTPLTQGFIA